MFSNESQTIVGDVIEHEDGSRYVVLPNGMLAYLGNRVLDRSSGLIERTGAPCKILGRIGLLPYVPKGEEEFDDIQEDWDMLRGRERFPIPLPKGCVCGHDALSAVLSCRVHRVSLADDPGEDVKDLSANPPLLSHLTHVRFMRQTVIKFGTDKDVVYEQGQVIQRSPGGPWPHPLLHLNIRQLWAQGRIEEFVREPMPRDELIDEVFGGEWYDSLRDD